MPAKNSQKIYSSNSYYHIYNRGVEKREIYQDEQDYGVFISYIKEYLLPKDKKSLTIRLANPEVTWREKDKILKAIRLNNFLDEITLLCYCLMPNHFHLLVKQKSEMSIDVFMNSLSTRYTMYFNRKYKRVGPLYQGVYKAVLVTSDEQLLFLSRYIHRNPLSLQGVALQILSDQHSSYSTYLGLKKFPWIQTNNILSYFSKDSSHKLYQEFVSESDSVELIEQIVIDSE